MNPDNSTESASSCFTKPSGILRWRNYRRLWGSSLGVLLLFAANGCGEARPQTVPAQGVATMADMDLNGLVIVLSPVANGDPNQREARGTIGAGGKFRVQTYYGADEPAQGAVPGKYTVSIAAGKIGESSMLPEDERLKKLPSQYLDAATSPIIVEVSASEPKDLVVDIIP